ncbi:MAG: hypothetical protein J3R72DRAFT_417579 [Linnemannia gamsii]|nr:MAG: hypothetical protein J3R72DRAFT_417579 [Linnemannia gamsii]
MSIVDEQEEEKPTCKTVDASVDEDKSMDIVTSVEAVAFVVTIDLPTKLPLIQTEQTVVSAPQAVPAVPEPLKMARWSPHRRACPEFMDKFEQAGPGQVTQNIDSRVTEVWGDWGLPCLILSVVLVSSESGSRLLLTAMTSNAIGLFDYG